MGLINQALQVGRSALLSYQSALQVVGNNISNAGSPDYTRQSAGLSPINGPAIPEGMRPGAGVALTSVKRNLDEALEGRIRVTMGANEADLAQQRAMSLVETLFDPVAGFQIAARSNAFFASLSDVQNTPNDVSNRQLAISNGAALASSLRDMRSSLAELGNGFNDQIAALVESANGIADRVAKLNSEIVAAEASGAPASALRDQRDVQLRDLSEIIDVRVKQQANGSTLVYLGNETLVDGGISRGLKVVSKFDGEFKRDDVAFADNNSQVVVRGGQLQGLIDARDVGAFGRIKDIDQLASAVIFEVNKAHSNGQGLTGFTSVTSSYAVDDPTAVLNSAQTGLPFSLDNGSFYIATVDQATGAIQSRQIQVDLDGIGDDDTTLESLIADINANVRGVNASLTSDNRLSIVAQPGVEFMFGFDGQTQRDDTSKMLAALGINTFFQGSTSADIAVNDALVGQPMMFAAASVSLSGDGSNAGRLADVGQQQSGLLTGASIVDFYGTIANQVAVQTATARNNVAASGSVLESLQAQKENISGVSLDEEAISLLKFERAFQGASRFISVVDRLSNELIALVR